MFNFISTDSTPSGIVDILHPMTATCGEFVRHDRLCKVAVTHTRQHGMLMAILKPDGNSYPLNEHERFLVKEFYTQQ
jgi:hypothetical protein